MMRLELIEEELKRMLTPRRFAHSLGARDAAVELAKRYGGDNAKAALAGLVHDCAKDLDEARIADLLKKYDLQLDEVSIREPALIHGPLGACMASDLFGIDDEEVLNAIRYHTTGKEAMTLLEKIIYLADYIEPTRDFPGVDRLRQAAESDLDAALLMAFDTTITYVISRAGLLHPNTVLARNYMIMGSKGGFLYR